jgi:toxin secretion/phage lysis holin
MEFISLKIKAIVAGGIAGIVALLGGWDKAMQILFILVVLDYLTGVCNAIKDHKVSSEIGYKGLLKKAMIFVVIILAAQLDNVIANPVHLFRTGVAFFYIANEGISITENVGKMGLPLPSFVKKVLEQLRDKSDKGEIE